MQLAVPDKRREQPAIQLVRRVEERKIANKDTGRLGVNESQNVGCGCVSIDK